MDLERTSTITSTAHLQSFSGQHAQSITLAALTTHVLARTRSKGLLQRRVIQSAVASCW